MKVKSIGTIQERLQERANEIAGEIEGSLDDYIKDGFKKQPSPYSIMYMNETKGPHARKLLDIFKKLKSEFDEVIYGEDEDLKEGYSCYTQAQLKKMSAYYDVVLKDIMKVIEEANRNRKPRIRKVKTPNQIVKKLKYCEKDNNLESIDPKEILGKMQLWVYNIKNRKLGVYFSEDATGLTVKGSSIVAFSPYKSITKKLRKPEDTIKELQSAKKSELNTFMDKITTKSSTLNGRINKDTILLKVR